MVQNVEITDAGDAAQVGRALTEAAAVAGRAPSIHNSQPWRWHIDGDVADLYLDHARELAITDPDHRLAILSCGAALHHARVSLAAQGWQVEVGRLPEPDNAEHLARVRITGRAPATGEATRLAARIGQRHTDRRPVTGTPVDPAALTAISQAVGAEGVHLHLLSRDQVIQLAAAAGYAQQTEQGETSWVAELEYWTGGTRPMGTGVPDEVIPQHPTQTTVPSREFGRPGTMPVSAEHDRAASFAILYGDEDAPLSWLRAGEALSAGWLTAGERGVSVVPMSAPIEVLTTREALRRVLAGLGHPYLVMRLGVADPDQPGPAQTPRLSPGDTIEVVEDSPEV
jgi:nitroreductase